MLRPKYTKPDENQAEIVADLRSMGAVVWDTHNIGGKVLDLVVFWRGRTVPIEVKQPGCEKELTDKEAEGMRELVSVGVFPLIVTRAEQAKAYIEELDARLEKQDHGRAAGRSRWPCQAQTCAPWRIGALGGSRHGHSRKRIV